MQKAFWPIVWTPTYLGGDPSDATVYIAIDTSTGLISRNLLYPAVFTQQVYKIDGIDASASQNKVSAYVIVSSLVNFFRRWHTGIVPVFLFRLYRSNGRFADRDDPAKVRIFVGKRPPEFFPGALCTYSVQGTVFQFNKAKKTLNLKQTFGNWVRNSKSMEGLTSEKRAS